MQSYFRALKDARLNSTHYILMKIGNKKELKRIGEEKSRHLDYKDFLKIYNYCTREPYSFMLIDTRLIAIVTFKKNSDESIINRFTRRVLRAKALGTAVRSKGLDFVVMSKTFINNDL